ncbi:DUF2252 domain-containing protein [Propionibacteriaceae bacterium G1746]|uniref:DUF2252 domain-containing protein n=1 Tax=Aestuariimicrobium sp. G57 TaxID=3418485 RepID=UPI003C132171
MPAPAPIAPGSVAFDSMTQMRTEVEQFVPNDDEVRIGDPAESVEQEFSVRRRNASRPVRMAYGKSLRDRVPRADLGLWTPTARTEDPVEQIIASHAGRIERLIPLRVARMTASPYGFLRGAANVAASDSSVMPYSGIMPVICGDAHLGNFGFYRTSEGELVIDLNDFDEAHPGPWEWDLRRLVASVWVAGRQNGLREDQCAEAVAQCVRAYRDELRHESAQPLLTRAFARLDVDRLSETVSEESLRDEVERATAKARRKTSDRALPKLTEPDGSGQRRIIDAPPITMRSPRERFEQIGEALDDYLTTLPTQWARTVSGYTLVDVAHKVVGVGSVGLRAFIALLEGSSPDDVLFLQLKQARRSVLAPYVHGDTPLHDHQGRRVVEYQQALQTASDPLLGWCSIGAVDPANTRLTMLPGDDGPEQHYYVRQYRNLKGAVVVDGLDAPALADYAKVLGLLLAKGHARTSGASMIAGYIGKSDTVPDAFVRFAQAYADQTEADHAAMLAAVKQGRLPQPEGE